MTGQRRRGTESSATRVLLLDVTERVMIDDGYAAVSSRRVARDAGCTAALVHYYFGTLDELFLAVLRRRGDQSVERLQRDIDSDRPLQALWRNGRDPRGAALLTELMALSNHRKVVRAELALYADRYRAAQLAALSTRLTRPGTGIDAGQVGPLVVAISCMSRGLAMEQALGMTVGVDGTDDYIDRLLATIDRTIAPDTDATP